MGPVELAGARGVAALGGPQRRLIVAMLIANRADGCSTDAIAEALWSEALPDTATTVLHAQISRLRRILEPDRAPRAPAAVLCSTATGYRLDLAGHTCDADTFEMLLDEGRNALARDDPGTARSRLAEALGAWRGPAYADFAGHPALLAAAAELDERRLVAREMFAEARLRLGEHAELVGELEGLVGDHPYREGLWRQLLLASYRCGRQADALAAFQRCRNRLVDDLGIEPGPELQRLNESILLQEPELDWRSAAPGSGRVSLPAVPPPRTSFVGRALEVAEAVDALKTRRLVTLTGTGGVGKTRLAGEVAARVGDDFHHGVAVCDLKPLTGPEQVLTAVAAAAGARADHDSGVESLTGHLAGREVLLVVDNADHTIEAVADLADRLLAECPRVRMLVTSREPLRADGEQLIALAPLSTGDVDDHACALFLDRARLSAPREILDPDAVLTVCQRLGGLPLALELAAGRLRSIPLDHLIKGLDEHLSAIATTPLPARASGHATLHEVVDWSVQLLDDRQRALLRRMAVFATGCTAATAASVCDLDTDPVEALADLVDRSLVEMDGSLDPTRYRLLETIRAHGLSQLAEYGELEAVRRRHLDWCLSLAPGDLDHGEDPDAFRQVAAELDDVVAALAWSLAGPDVAAGAALAIIATPVWVNAGRLDEARTWLDRAVAATDPHDPVHRTATRWLGWVLGRQGRFGESRERLATAADLARRGGDRQAELDAELLLGGIEIEAGDLAAGEARLRSHAENEGAEDHRRRAHRCHALGVRALLSGELDPAVRLLEEATREAREARMWLTLVRSLTSLAQSESGRGNHHRADGALAEGLALARRHRLLGLMPRLLGVRAIISGRRGDWASARSLFEEALAAARLVGDVRVEQITLTNIGVVHLHQDRAMDALEPLEEAVLLADEAGDERSGLLTQAILAEAVVRGPRDIARALGLVADAVTRSRAAGIRIATIAAVESAGLALVDRGGRDNLWAAARLLGACSAEREALAYPEGDSNDTISKARAQLREGLGTRGLDTADGEGREAGLDAEADRLLALQVAGK